MIDQAWIRVQHPRTASTSPGGSRGVDARRVPGRDCRRASEAPGDATAQAGYTSGTPAGRTGRPSIDGSVGGGFQTYGSIAARCALSFAQLVNPYDRAMHELRVGQLKARGLLKGRARVELATSATASACPAHTDDCSRFASLRRCSSDGLFGSGRVGIATSSPAISGLVACGPHHQARKWLAVNDPM